METTPERRQAKRFEPPPWERPQFDELEQQRLRQEQENAAAAEALRLAQARLAEETDAASPAGNVAAEQPGGAGGVETVADASSSVGRRPVKEVVGPQGLTERQMLLMLKAEEAPASRGVTTAATVISGLVVVFGAVLMIWGIVAFFATRGATDQRGTWGAATMIVFGMLFMGLGAYQGYKTMQKRGVL